jgi:hypothetical protein
VRGLRCQLLWRVGDRSQAIGEAALAVPLQPLPTTFAVFEGFGGPALVLAMASGLEMAGPQRRTTTLALQRLAWFARILPIGRARHLTATGWLGINGPPVRVERLAWRAEGQARATGMMPDVGLADELRRALATRQAQAG